MSDSDAVISEPKHLTDSEMLHYPSPRTHTMQIHVETGMPQGQSSLYHCTNPWKSLPDP